ncbi:putative pantothenate transporter [Diaporthe ampelina]|uniref:Putative pantothenate transporter n=1 Tax=Diaporthe ampelina TaxID=1214573 RepID=A0A0G2IE37_9PEZI|nr:putative pantothenate transporter [Diaporthe ampelina]
MAAAKVPIVITEGDDTTRTGDSKNDLHLTRRGADIDEAIATGGISGFDAERMRARASLTAEEEKKLMRRVDLRIMTLCSLLFLFKNIDSDNISNARIMNRGTDRNIMTQLGLTSDEYNLLTVFYYVQEGSQDGNALASRLFLVEGVVTVVFGLIIYFILPDFPPTAKWLTEKEKAFIQARLPPNAPRAGEMDFKFSEIISSLKDKRLWLFTLIWATFTIGTSGVRFYQPTVIANLGFTTIARAQLLNLPISILSIIVIGITGWFADNGRLPRPIYPITLMTIILACYGVMVAYPSNGAVYTATLIGNAVTSSWFPMMWPWRVQTTSRATGSAFSIGFVNSYGQIGGAVGPQIFLSKYAPRYTQSFGAAMACVGACVVVTLVTWWVTREIESETRRLKRAKVKASKDGMAVLDDVVV